MDSGAEPAPEPEPQPEAEAEEEGLSPEEIEVLPRPHVAYCAPCCPPVSVSLRVRARVDYISVPRLNCVLANCAQAKAEAEAAIEMAQLQAEDKEQILLDIVVLYSDDGYVDPPPGYWKVPYDLNKGAGGIFIYLATKTCSRQDPGLLMDGPNGLGTPITDLCVITGKSKDIQAPVGYTKVEGDLNQGTGGNFVYLCFHRGQLAEQIAELFTMGGKTSEVLSPPPGYAKIDADLNAGEWACTLRHAAPALPRGSQIYPSGRAGNLTSRLGCCVFV